METHSEKYKCFEIVANKFTKQGGWTCNCYTDLSVKEIVDHICPDFSFKNLGEAIANAKARIDEAISQKVEELESQLELLKSFDRDSDKNVKIGSIVEISFVDPEIEPGQKICLTVKSIKVNKSSTFIYLDTANEFIKTEDDSYIILKIGNHICCNSLSGLFDEENGPEFAGSFDIDWKLIQE